MLGKCFFVIFLLCAFLMTGCQSPETAENTRSSASEMEFCTADSPSEPLAVTEETLLPELREPVTVPEPADAAPVREEIPPAEVFFSLREEELPADPSFSDALAEAVSAELPGRSVCIRVTDLQCWTENGVTRYDAGYEVYPADARICGGTCMGTLSTGLSYTPEDGYLPAEAIVIDADSSDKVRAALEHYDPDAVDPPDVTYLYLDRENRIWMHLQGTEVPTELFYKGYIGDLDYSNLLYIDIEKNTIVLCGRESSYYTEPVTVSISRDNGANWYTETPVLEPLGANRQHIEAGFTTGRIQVMEDGQVYIFLGTNLASMTVLSVPVGADDVQVLFREQIGGYETTALVEAAMVSETRGFYTLRHPKYAASNAIYRTTDGGESWIRCSVPMPEAVQNPWEMSLYLPWQTEEGATWYMNGVWDTGECTYLSTDGGWTWTIME